MKCNLCPKHCNAERSETEGKGFCKVGTSPKIARIAPHMWEEPCISGTNGSGTIFFSGCTLGCVFCQNYLISAQKQGAIITVNKLVDEIKKLEEKNVHNINLVSPTPYVDAILEAFSIYKPSIPVVYNSSGYEDIDTLKKLDGYINIYLPDFKYSNNELAIKYSGVKNYVETTTEAIQEMINQTGKINIDSAGIMTRGTIVRHLILPNHTKNSLGVLDILEKFEGDFLVSLMGQYVPSGIAEKYEKLNRKITRREYEKVKNYLFDLGFDGFVQDLKSASEKYIPQWDYK